MMRHKNSLQLARLQTGARPRLPVILQAEMAECGLACLAMLSAYYGRRQDLTRLRERLGVGQQGATLKQLMRMAHRESMTARALRCDVSEISQMQLPAILHWDFDHFVVVAQASSRRLVVHDPARGVVRLSLDEAARHFTGVALELTPDTEFQPADERTSLSLLAFMGKLPGVLPVLGQILLLSAVLQLIALASPFYMQLVVDDVLTKQDPELLTLLASGFLLITLLSTITHLIRGWTSIYLTNQLSLVFGSRLFHRLLGLKPDYFMKRHLGDIVSRFGSLKPVQEFLTSSAITLLLDGVMAATTLILIVIYSPQLALVIAITLLIYLSSQVAFYLPIKDRTHEKIAADASLDSNFMESIRSINAIKRFGAEQQRESDWQNRFTDAINADIRLGWLGLSREFIDNALSGFSQVIIIYLGARQVLAGQMTIGMLFAFMAYRSHFVGAATSLVNEFIRYLMLSLHLERLSDIQLSAQSPATTLPQTVEANLSLRNISFRHAEDQAWLLKGLQLEVMVGDCLCILGPSGCGKSTLLNIMQNLLQPTQGEVYVSGFALQGQGAGAIKFHSASVMQGDTLLSGSLRSNIAFNDPQPDQQRILWAAQTACIDADISAMPMGYDSIMGDMGTLLSAGQQSRVLIARALYQQPKFLFLDECTAHLDEQTEGQVLMNIMQLPLTCIFVTHNQRLRSLATLEITLEMGAYRVTRHCPPRQITADRPQIQPHSDTPEP